VNDEPKFWAPFKLNREMPIGSETHAVPKEVSLTGERTHSLEAACGLQRVKQMLSNFQRTKARALCPALFSCQGKMSLCRSEILPQENLGVLEQGLGGCGGVWSML